MTRGSKTIENWFVAFGETGKKTEKEKRKKKFDQNASQSHLQTKHANVRLEKKLLKKFEKEKEWKSVTKNIRRINWLEKVMSKLYVSDRRKSNDIKIVIKQKDTKKQKGRKDLPRKLKRRR